MVVVVKEAGKRGMAEEVCVLPSAGAQPLSAFGSDVGDDAINYCSTFCWMGILALHTDVQEL